MDEFLKQTVNVTIKQESNELKYKIIVFYKETEFKDTPIGKIPKEWDISRLEYLASAVYYGVTAKAVEHNTSLKMLRTTDIKDYKVDWASLPYCEITSKVNNIEKYLLRKGDLIVSRAGTVGISVLVDRNFDNVVFGSYLIKVRLKESLVYPKFIHYYFQSYQYWKHISKAQGSTLKNINLGILKSLLVPLPPLEEQRGIAEILSTLDNAIEVSVEYIEKLERLKRDLMQELLTKGIGHREFRETPIGKIPKEWQVVPLSRIAKIIMGQSPPSSTYNEESVGLPFLQGKAEFGRIYPTPKVYTSKPIKIAEKGDLLISVRAPVGDVNIAPYRLCIGRGLAAIRFASNVANTLFYFYYFNFIKPRLETMGKGSTFKAITKKDLESLLVPKPLIEEQKRIATILSSIDEWIELEKRRKEKLERLKHGLMELLLTGRVRVRVETVGSFSGG